MKNIPHNARLYVVAIVSTFSSFTVSAQQQQKQVTNLSQTWIGFNSLFRLNNKWGISADGNYRSKQFFSGDYYSISRMGINYWVNDDILLTAGFGHQWTAPKIKGWHTIANENRLYQQIMVSSKVGRVSISNRLRNEERWQEKIVADTNTHISVFTDRVRYQLMLVVPFTRNPYFPSLVVSDELMLQMGKTIVYNTFDQNRSFIGLRETITGNLSCDFGYMLVDQQKSTGYQYERDHLLRVFFLYNPDCRKKK